MNKEFIPYEQALQLKELGFDEECFKWYTGMKSFVDAGKSNQPDLTYACSAPLYQQVFRWFREKTITNLVVNDKGDTIQGMFTLLPLIYLNSYEIHVIKESDTQFVNHVSGQNIPFYGAARHKYHDYAPSYDEAQLACLKKLIEIVKNK